MCAGRSSLQRQGRAAEHRLGGCVIVILVIISATIILMIIIMNIIIKIIRSHFGSSQP